MWDHYTAPCDDEALLVLMKQFLSQALLKKFVRIFTMEHYIACLLDPLQRSLPAYLLAQNAQLLKEVEKEIEQRVKKISEHLAKKKKAK